MSHANLSVFHSISFLLAVSLVLTLPPIRGFNLNARCLIPIYAMRHLRIQDYQLSKAVNEHKALQDGNTISIAENAAGTLLVVGLSRQVFPFSIARLGW